MDNKTRYDLKYKKDHLHRVALDVRKEDLEALRAAAAMDGCSLNGWIKKLMFSRCAALGVPVPSRSGSAPGFPE